MPIALATKDLFPTLKKLQGAATAKVYARAIIFTSVARILTSLIGLHIYTLDICKRGSRLPHKKAHHPGRATSPDATLRDLTAPLSGPMPNTISVRVGLVPARAESPIHAVILLDAQSEIFSSVWECLNERRSRVGNTSDYGPATHFPQY